MRYAIAIEYNGSQFCGWQRQKHSRSVQEVVEAALTRVADHPVTVVCAGRTDTGVHAQAQIAHFDTSAERPDRAWTFGVNTHLPPSVSIHWVGRVADDFHARFKAVERSYRYTILNRACRPGYLREYVSWVGLPLNENLMHEAAQQLRGTHDFSAFRSADCQAPHAVRTLTHLGVTRDRDEIQVEIRGNAFLHNMVRIIAGSLIKIGREERSVPWLGEILANRDRTQSGVTAPAAGLCFLQASYADEWGIPQFIHR